MDFMSVFLPVLILGVVIVAVLVVVATVASAVSAAAVEDEGMYVFEQHPRIFCVILGMSGNQRGVSGNQSGNGKSGPFWIRFPGVCFSHQLQSANAAWGG